MNSNGDSRRKPLVHPYVLLILTFLAWGGHTTAGRMAVSEASPMAITTLRWLVTFLLLAVLVRRDIPAITRVVRERPLFLLTMGFIGFTGFNALYYVGAQYTTAINMGIMQAIVPLVIIAGAVFVQGERATPGMLLGLVLGTAGVVVVVSGGDLSRIAAISFNRGDVLILIASIMFAAYSLGIRSSPRDISGIAFFAGLAGAAFLTSLPLIAWEVATDTFRAPTLKGWLIIAWIGIFPSLLAQLWYLKGVAAVGASRASFLYNLIPIFSAMIAVTVLGEQFGWHHAVGTVLVIGGILIAERSR